MCPELLNVPESVRPCEDAYLPPRRHGGQKSERHASIPYRIWDAFALSELDEWDLVLIVYFTAHVIPPRWKHARQLAALAGDVRWKASLDTLARRLEALRDAGWIDFTKPKAGATGRHAAWVFWLRDAHLLTQEAELSTETDLQAEVPTQLRTSSAEAPHHLRKTDPQNAEPDSEMRSFEGAANGIASGIQAHEASGSAELTRHRPTRTPKAPPVTQQNGRSSAGWVREDDGLEEVLRLLRTPPTDTQRLEVADCYRVNPTAAMQLARELAEDAAVRKPLLVFLDRCRRGDLPGVACERDPADLILNLAQNIRGSEGWEAEVWARSKEVGLARADVERIIEEVRR